MYLGKNEHIPEIEKYYRPLQGYDCVYINKGIAVKQPQSELQDTAKPNNEMPSFVRPNIFR